MSDEEERRAKAEEQKLLDTLPKEKKRAYLKEKVKLAKQRNARVGFEKRLASLSYAYKCGEKGRLQSDEGLNMTPSKTFDPNDPKSFQGTRLEDYISRNCGSIKRQYDKAVDKLYEQS
tara:strand:- start:112 stop:465 length:354 start_codon:yes stop_codon:yes gene_type:complete